MPYKPIGTVLVVDLEQMDLLFGTTVLTFSIPVLSVLVVIFVTV